MGTLQSYSVLSPHPTPSHDLECVVCDFCGSDDAQTLAKLQPPNELPFPMHRLGAQALDFANTAIHFVRCKRCGLVYMNPRLTEPAIARFYDTVYAQPGAAQAFESDQTKHNTYVLNRAAQLLMTGEARPKILDIGCGAGQLLHTAQTRGWQVFGSELSRVAAERASTRLGVPIHVGDFRDMELAPASLDVVTILAVIEHVRAPVEYVRDAAKMLKPGGVLVIEMPNVASLEYYVASALGQTWRGFIVEHLYYFAPLFVRRLLESLDLELVTLSSKLPWSQLPNPLRDMAAMLKPPAKQASAVEGVAIPALPPVSTTRRVMRQMNNYALDALSWLTDQGGTRGNTLIAWARKPENVSQPG